MHALHACIHKLLHACTHMSVSMLETRHIVIVILIVFDGGKVGSLGGVCASEILRLCAI